MKLITKTNRIYITVSTAVFVIAGTLLFFILKYTINNEVDEGLYNDIIRITKQIEITGKPVNLYPIINVNKLINSNINKNFYIKDTLIFDKNERENILFRELGKVIKIKNKKYKIIVRQSLLETDDYLSSIGTTIIIEFILLIILMSVVLKINAKNIWADFYFNLKILKNYSLNNTSQIKLKNSKITEFNELNEAILKLTTKIQSDYKSLKEFTEDASHEIQTPLAIMLSKLDFIIQKDTLNKDDLSAIMQVYAAAKRLSKLNQSLLLLTKIQNQQFGKIEKINLNKIINNQLAISEELILFKKLKIIFNTEKQINLNVSKGLIEILIANIINNAIKYTIKGKEIKIEITAKELTITNFSEPITINPNKFFNRFYKFKSKSNSLGLGLAIVYKICENYCWNIQYATKNEWHCIRINF